MDIVVEFVRPVLEDGPVFRLVVLVFLSIIFIKA